MIELLGGDDRSAIRNWVLRFGDRVDVDLSAPGGIVVTDWWGDPARQVPLRYPLDICDFWLQVDEMSRRAAEGGTLPEPPPPEMHMAPWFQGPMVAGGYGWSLTDIASQTTTCYPTRFRVLDSYLGGIRPGEIWSISGEACTGVTALTVGLATGLAASADVLLANSHVPTLDLVEMISRVRVPHTKDRLRVTSWQVAWYGPEGPASGLDALDERLHFDIGRGGVVILDTWDEQVPALNDRATAIAALRGLRRLAERHEVAVILTSRTPRHLVAGETSMLDDVFDDVSTVRFRIASETTPWQMPKVVVRRRGRSGPATFAFSSLPSGVRIYDIRDL